MTPGPSTSSEVGGPVAIPDRFRLNFLRPRAM